MNVFLAPLGLQVEILALHALGAWLFLAPGASIAQQAAGLVVLGMVSGRCGWLMHEGGHYSLTGHIKLDRALQASPPPLMLFRPPRLRACVHARLVLRRFTS